MKMTKELEAAEAALGRKLLKEEKLIYNLMKDNKAYKPSVDKKGKLQYVLA